MPRWFLYVTVFFTGLSVTAIELTASRFLAPFFGASIFVWSNVIGLVLAALALGYYIGGKLADRDPSAAKLYLLIFIAGILTNIVPFAGRPIMAAAFWLFAERTDGVLLGSFMAVLILFALPILLLGMVSPWVAKIASNKLENIGKTVGNLYSFSTVGSILGVFLPVMMTIPYLGTARTFILFGTILMALGAFGIGKKKLFSLTALFSLAIFFPMSVYSSNSSVIAEKESMYNTIHIKEDEPGGMRYMIINEGRGVQSQYNPGWLFSGQYWDFASVMPLVIKKADNAVFIGVAGGTALRTMRLIYPDIKIEGVDVDQDVLTLARDFFDLRETPNLTTHVADGRMFLRMSKNKYDLMMIDAYAQVINIPFHMVTKEFFAETKSKLSPDGAMFMNVATFDNNAMVDAIANTVSFVFEYTYRWQMPHSDNIMIVAASQPIPAHDIRNAGITIPSYLSTLRDDFVTRKAEIQYDPRGITFTDDRAPIEMMARL